MALSNGFKTRGVNESLPGRSLPLVAGNGGDAGPANGGVGGNATLYAGSGGAAIGGESAGSGGNTIISGGAGGDASDVSNEPGNGGNVSIAGGNSGTDAGAGAYKDGGDVTITGGNGEQSGGDVVIKGGAGTNGNGGTVKIDGDDISGSGVGDVLIGTQASTVTVVIGRTGKAWTSDGTQYSKGRVHSFYQLVPSATPGSDTYTMTDEDEIVGVDTASYATHVVLPQAFFGKTVTVVDIRGNASTHNITLTSGFGQQIQGAASYVMSANRESVTLVGTALGWVII